MRACIFIRLFFVVYIVPAYAQLDNGYIINEYNTENGLPANGIKGIAYDRKTNFLWVATEAGIMRFNGQDFKTFTTRDLPQLSSERISRLITNKAGDILIFDTENNIFRIEKNKPVLYKKADKADIINYNRLLASMLANPELSQKIEKADSNYNFNIFNTIVDIDDTACLLTNNHNEILYFSASRKYPDSITKKSPFTPTLFKIDHSPFFLNNEGLVFKINLAQKTTSQVSITSNAGEIHAEQIKKGLLLWDNHEQNTILFIGRNAYSLSFNGQQLSAQLICNEIPTTSNIRYALYHPDSKQIFIGTQSKGVIIIKPKYFKAVKKTDNNPLIPNATYTQIEVADYQILTNDLPVLGTENNKQPFTPIKEKFGFSTYLFRDSVLLYSKRHAETQNHTVHSYNYYTGVTTGYPKIRINSTFGAALSNHKIYLATRAGFGVLKGDSIEYLIKPPHDASEGVSAIDMEEISPGIFLTASCSGLIEFDSHTKKADTLLHYPGNCFRTIQKIGDYFFIGTYGAGFFIYKNGVIKPMPLDKEKYLLYTHCFMPDNTGFCWISTNRGLFKVKISDMVRGFTENNPAIYYHYFGKNDGIEMTELNGGCTPCAIQLNDRTLSFPSMDGLLWLHPDSIPDILPGSDVFIDDMIADGKSIEENIEEIKLPPLTKSITLKLSYNGWGNKENIYFDYSIGKDGVWKPVNTDEGAIIQLDNLPAGNYQLTIRKLNGFGAQNYTYKIIAFSIEKPWFNQWWFYLLCMLGAFTVIRVYLHYKTRKLEADRLALEQQVADKTKALQQKNAALEKSNSVQTRLISIISHDIITPLKFMAVGGKELMEKHAVMPESLRQETIEEITHTAQELQLLSTNIMNWMKYQNENRKQVKESFNLHDVSNQVTGIHKSIARQKKIPLKNNIPPGLIIYQYYEPLKILLYNLLSNAINFSMSGEIIITANQRDNHIMLSVEDKGVGMTQEQIKNILSDDFIISSANIDNRKGNGLGYLIIKDLLKMIDGKIAIESRKGKGTVVSVTFPSIKDLMTI